METKEKILFFGYTVLTAVLIAEHLDDAMVINYFYIKEVSLSAISAILNAVIQMDPFMSIFV